MPWSYTDLDTFAFQHLNNSYMDVLLYTICCKQRPGVPGWSSHKLNDHGAVDLFRKKKKKKKDIHQIYHELPWRVGNIYKTDKSSDVLFFPGSNLQQILNSPGAKVCLYNKNLIGFNSSWRDKWQTTKWPGQCHVWMTSDSKITPHLSLKPFLWVCLWSVL